MNSGKTRIFGTGSGQSSFGLSPYAAGLSLILLLWGLLSNAETYGNVEYGFSLLAILGTLGYIGHLAAYAYRSSGYLSSARSVLGNAGPIEAPRSGSILVASAGWPLLVALLFGPFSILLAGLGGC